jgi:hypothetical protein
MTGFLFRSGGVVTSSCVHVGIEAHATDRLTSSTRSVLVILETVGIDTQIERGV